MSDIRQRPEGALLRTYLRAAGIAPESFSKPLIGVAAAASQVFSERPDARELGNAAATGLEKAGGIAIRWDTVRSPELMTWGHAESYSFAFRDQLADMIESWTRQQALDGLVLVGDAPETLVGMAMAAARLNIPAVVIPVVSTRWEYSQDVEAGAKKKDAGDPFQILTETLFAKKKIGAEVVADPFTKCLLAHDNHADNAMYLAFEALGLSLPGIATAAPKSVKLHELAFSSGERIVELVKSGTTTRRILTQNAFTNAIRLNAAFGGSVDAAVHLMALAHESGVNLSIDLFDKVARETPQVIQLGAVGGKEPHRLEDLDKAGGVWAVLHALKTLVLPNPTISGKGALELAKTSNVKDSHVIASRPHHKQSGLGVLKGNLASRGAVFLLNQVTKELEQFRGPAMIYESEITAAEALIQNEIKKGSVIVVRNQGPRGGPGLRKLRILPALLESRGLNKIYPVITDGRLPDNPVGLFVSFVSPEGATKGPLGILKNGDFIEIDIEARSLGVRLTETELQIRYARWQPPESASARGFLGRYSRQVSEAQEGAVLK
jgi:dihydroxy-acid dehydratase